MAGKFCDHLNLDLDVDLYKSDKDSEFVPETKKEKQKPKYRLVSLLVL